MGLKFQFFLNDKEMNKVSFHVNIVCIFLYFSRNTFYGGEKFLHQKAVFFYFVNNSDSYWQKHTKLQFQLDNMFLHVTLKILLNY
jgi:hypothetical protein